MKRIHNDIGILKDWMPPMMRGGPKEYVDVWSAWATIAIPVFHAIEGEDKEFVYDSLWWICL